MHMPEPDRLCLDDRLVGPSAIDRSAARMSSVCFERHSIVLSRSSRQQQAPGSEEKDKPKREGLADSEALCISEVAMLVVVPTLDV